MRIQFLKDTNIRREPSSVGNDPIGVIRANVEIDVEDNIYKGMAISSQNVWYKDQNGWYYWSGQTRVVPVALPGPQPPVVVTPASPNLPLPPEPLPDSRIPQGETRFVPDVPLRWWESRSPGTDNDGAEILVDAGVDSPIIFDDLDDDALESLPVATASGILPLLTKGDLSERPVSGVLHWALNEHTIPQQWWKEQELTGLGVTIAVLSTGVMADHPDLVGAVTAFHGSHPNEAMGDQHGIGTQAALIAAGHGSMVSGVAPDASLLIGRIGHFEWDITPESLMEGIRWAAAQQADIVAMLVDFPSLDPDQKMQLQELIEQLNAAGTLLLAPVGNSAERRPEDRFPASLEGVLSIGSYDEAGQRSSFSAKSANLDVLAPGEGIPVSPGANGASADNLHNTAIATAYTAGFLALIRQWEIHQQRGFSPAEIADLLRKTALKRGAVLQDRNVDYGYGLLNPSGILDELKKS